MNAFELARELGHEEVVILRLGPTGLRAVIAIHDSTLGPAVGGTRMRLYASFDDAIVDALRLSRAMTYKAALADMAWGGAKAVIPGDPGRDKTQAFYVAYAEALDRLGRFQTGGDMGIDASDVLAVARLTPLMSHVPATSSVDASDLTAIGVLAGIRAAAAALGRELAGLHVAVQGLGEVGSRLARRLAAEGVRLTVTDVVAARTERVVAECGAVAVPAEAIFGIEADVFSPCAAGGILNDQTIPRLRCRAVVGAANEQLLEPNHGDALLARGILYAPDYLVNAGGLLSLLFERGEADEAGIVKRVEAIGPRLAALWERGRAEGLPPQVVADRMVEERLAKARRA
jgi:leucine dehydrogenase